MERVGGPLAALLVLGSASLPLARPASAALVVADFETAGDGLLTIDTGTGLKWLDWARTAGMSVNQVIPELGPGGQFAGFRYATNAEVTTFWLNAGIPDVPGITLANLGPVQDLIPLLGVTISNSSVAAGSIGFTNDVSGGLRFEATLADRTPLDGFGQVTFNRTVGITDDSQQPTRGHALVIPEPASALLLLAALGGLALARRRLAAG